MPKSSLKLVIFAGLLGEIVEWYDFVLYGFFATTLAKVFFASLSNTEALLATFAGFAVGFITRPLGGLIFGRLADISGRKNVFSKTILLMGIPSMLIGCLPTFHQIGLLAPILLIVLRLLQGLALGGEFTTSMIFLAEHGNVKRQGFFGSLACIGSISGTIIASLVAAVMTHNLSPEALMTWGWRCAFIAGGVAVIVAVWLRKRVSETPVFIQLQQQQQLSSQPLRDSWKQPNHTLLLIALLNIQFAISSYLCLIFLPNYLIHFLHQSAISTLQQNSLFMLAMLLLIPSFGWLSDRIGFPRLMTLAGFAMLLVSYPAFVGLANPNWSWLAHLALLTPTAAVMGCSAKTMMTLSQQNIRLTTVSIPYNLAMAIFGGTTPLLATYLIIHLHSTLAPVLCCAFAGTVTLLAVSWHRWQTAK